MDIHACRHLRAELSSWVERCIVGVLMHSLTALITTGIASTSVDLI